MTTNAPDVLAALQDFLNKREDGDLYLTHHSMDTSKMELVEMIEGLMGNAPDGGEVWRLIETAPKDGTRFLALDGDRHFDCWMTCAPRDGCYWMDEADSEPAPTHWMPLPAAPGSAPPAPAASPASGVMQEALDFVNEASGAALGIAMSGSDHPNPDEILMNLSRKGMALATRLSAALSKHGGNDA